jgi:hypothetical protein
MNSQGIYVIDCHNESLTIEDCRINATIVVLRPDQGIVVDGRINWEPPTANYPALMVQGGVQMDWDGGLPLTEGGMATNFNPAGSPYGAVADVDLSDVYPGLMSGLVYTSGGAWISNDMLLNGVMVVGGVSYFSDNANLTFNAAPSTNPPPGFAIGNVMRVIPRTWQRAAR